MGVVQTGPGSPLSPASANGGKVSGFNTLSSVGATAVLAQNGNRVSITFHNPGGNDVLVFPTVQANGSTNAPTPAAPGGGFRVFANGGTVVITGECQTPWAAMSFSGTGSLTVMESNV